MIVNEFFARCPLYLRDEDSGIDHEQICTRFVIRALFAVDFV